MTSYCQHYVGVGLLIPLQPWMSNLKTDELIQVLKRLVEVH